VLSGAGQNLFSLFLTPQPSDDERLTSSEWMHVMEFHSFWPPLQYSPRLLTSQLGTDVGIELYNVPHLNSHSSNLYRSAVLVLMSYLKNKSSSNTPRYLAKYHHEGQKCIDNASDLEVVFASYMLAVYSLLGGGSRR
jgi:hypothetical protein